jgi:hemolysin type calcium-binding protein
MRRMGNAWPRVVVAGTVGVAVLAALTASEAAAGGGSADRCFGRAPTIVGTNGADVLRGTTPGPDVIVGRGGDDRIRPGRGLDRVCSGSGDFDHVGAVSGCGPGVWRPWDR